MRKSIWGGLVAAFIVATGVFSWGSTPVSAYYSNGVGDGSSGDPYHVLNCSNLSNINTAEDAHYVLDHDINCVGFELSELIGDLNSTSNGFSGSFDGQNHEITGLNIDKASDDSVGLFARISGSGVVKNLSVTANVRGDRNVGILAGDIQDNAQIERVTVFGSVTGNENCGGIVGNQGNASIITKSGSYATVDNSGISAGGLVGWVSHGGTINLSYASGSVSGTLYVGGLVGAINTISGTSTITDTYSDATVTASQDYAGGLVGMASSLDLTNSYAAGSVTGDDSVGGLVGLFSSGNMAELFSAAEVHGTGGAVGPVTGHFGTGTVGNRYFDTVRSGFSSSPDGSSPINTASDPDYFFDSTNPPMSTWTFDSTHWRINYNYYPSLAPLFDPIMLCEAPQSTNTTMLGTCGIMPLGWGETTWEARWRKKNTSTWHNITLENSHLAQTTVEGLTPGTWYQLQFRFTNNFGMGTWGTLEILTTGTTPIDHSSSDPVSESSSSLDADDDLLFLPSVTSTDSSDPEQESPADNLSYDDDGTNDVTDSPSDTTPTPKEQATSTPNVVLLGGSIITIVLIGWLIKTIFTSKS